MKNKLYKNIKDFGLSTLAALLIISCATKQTTATNTKIAEVYPKLIFLNYTISKNEMGNKKIQFINKIQTEGKLKNVSNKYLKFGTLGDLKCSQLDKDSVEIISVIIKNPLIKHIEIISDSLIFENKIIELRNAPFSLRLQLHNKTKFIAINEIEDSLQNTLPLFITKID